MTWLLLALPVIVICSLLLLIAEQQSALNRSMIRGSRSYWSRGWRSGDRLN